MNASSLVRSLSRLWAVTLVLLALVTASPARAHSGPTTSMTIDVVSETDARIVMTSPLTLVAGDGCSLEPQAPNAIRVLHCRGGVAGASLEVVGLEATIPGKARTDLVLVRLTGDARRHGPESADESFVLTAREPSLTIPGSPSRDNVVLRFVGLGIEHVLSGLDHVLFMVALFCQAWLRSGRAGYARLARELLRTATAFTVAHSLTLAATVLGWMSFPSSVAAACLAASLVLVALDIDAPRRTREDGGATASVPRGAPRPAYGHTAVVFAFGVVHGLGFAGALAKTRLPEHAVALGLLSFNVGVELAQVLVFGSGVLILLLLRRRSSSSKDKVAHLAWNALPTLSAYAVGISGVAMFLARFTAILRS